MLRAIAGILAICCLGSSVAAGDEFRSLSGETVLAHAEPLPDDVLDSYRGGFVLPDGTEVDLSLTILHRVDGMVVTRRTLSTLDILRGNGVVNRLVVRNENGQRSIISEIVSANSAGGLRNVIRNSTNQIRLENSAQLDVAVSGLENLKDTIQSSVSKGRLNVNLD